MIACIVLIVLSALSAHFNYPVHQRLHANFLNRSSELEIVDIGGGFPIEAHERFLLKRGATAKLISTLNDFNGAVTIRSQAEAINFVRLSTSPETWYLWPTPPRLEVIDSSEFHKLPNYGIPHVDYSGMGSGFFGILSPSAQSIVGSASIRCHWDGHFYLIERRLLTQTSDAYDVLCVQEKVSPNGSYRCHVTAKYLAPNLPETEWFIPKFD